MPDGSLDADVLVVGYGPVGAVLAALLGAGGRRVAVVERDAEPAGQPRAIAADDEVLRVLVGLPGLGDLLDRVNALQRAAFVDRRHRVLVEMAFGESDLGLPGLAFFHQPTLERSLRDGIAGLPTVRVLPGRAVTGLEQGPAAATVRLDDGTRLSARFVVGCDGGSSTVRQLLGLRYGGTTFAQPWLVVDVETDRPLPNLPYFAYVCDPARPTVTMPMPGGHRWEWMLHPGEDHERLASPASVRALLAPYVDPDTVRVVRACVYTFHARVADRWRVGRVLLAGDAAHCMPPFAGQGLGAGVRDAAALAWRLDEVVRGLAGAGLLDQYEAERRPHVEAMTDVALLAGRVLQSTNPAAAALARWLLRAAGRTPLLGPRLRRGELRPPPGLPAAAGAPPGCGAMVPNPRVRTLAGRVCRLDGLLGAGWALLGAGGDPLAGAGSATRGWLRDRSGAALAVVPPGGLRAAAGLACPAVEDLDGTLLRLLGARRPAPAAAAVPVAVVRPDRYLLGVLPAGRLDGVLPGWPDRLPLASRPDRRAAVVRRLARPARAARRRPASPAPGPPDSAH